VEAVSTRSPWVISIHGQPCRWGAQPVPDSLVVVVPDRWYVDLGDGKPPAMLAQLAGRELRQLSEQAAATTARGQLLRADWVVTTDPVQVTEVAESGCSCEECQRAHADTLRYMWEHPGAEVAAGLLWFASSGPPQQRGGGGQ